MESELSADKALRTPPVPIKTYQWEDLRRARDAGGYPWTHYLKPPLEGVITAQDIIKETTPIRSMSRDVSRSRTHSPDHRGSQRILNLDCSPGSSRKHGEEGQDEGIQIPNFSKEISLDSDEDNAKRAPEVSANNNDIEIADLHLTTPTGVPKNVSPKSILKRRTPDPQAVTVSETRDKTKCCHPLVNKIKHLADKTLQKLERNDTEKSPVSKRKKNEETQEIRQLKSSPGAVRRQKFSAIKLGDSDEMSKSLNIDTSPIAKTRKEHIYEDIDEAKARDIENNCNSHSEENAIRLVPVNKEDENTSEKKSLTSQDPSLVIEENIILSPEEQIMEILHKNENGKIELRTVELDNEEPNIDEIFQNQLDEINERRGHTTITITEVTDDLQGSEPHLSANDANDDAIHSEAISNVSADWSKTSSDHEYEIIEKPQIIIPDEVVEIEQPLSYDKDEDELSSTTSLERKYFQHASDEEQDNNKDNNPDDIADNDLLNAETMQKNIEDRYFVSTPSTVSRTECDVSTSQVDSSALENLPLKRDRRSKHLDLLDNKLQQRLRESTGKLKSQAGKLKTKLQHIKNKQFTLPERSKIKFPERHRFKLPERPKISLPERPKFALPERRKFNFPERPRFKKINITEKLSFGEGRKFSFPDKPKFVSDLPKFKLPDRSKLNFPSLTKKKQYKIENESFPSSDDAPKTVNIEFETTTYPRLFSRRKKIETLTSSSPMINRPDTPPPTFSFAKVSNERYGNNNMDRPAQPREYGNIESTDDFKENNLSNAYIKATEDFNEVSSEPYKEYYNTSLVSNSDISSSKPDCTHVINEINNDEFFVRPRGISRENIQVRKYLSDEIRQAFQIPKNALSSMGSNNGNFEDPLYTNDAEADPELMLDENEPDHYSTEDLDDKDDGYYTFPPVRPSRGKRKKKEIDQTEHNGSVTQLNDSMQFIDVDLSQTEIRCEDTLETDTENINDELKQQDQNNSNQNAPSSDNAYYYGNVIEANTLPCIPKRKKKIITKDCFSSLQDIDNAKNIMWDSSSDHQDEMIVYRTEHEYIVPEATTVVSEQSPVAPRRSRLSSRISHATSVCDDDRTSHGAESLTLDTHLPLNEDISYSREIRHESPGYATVDKTAHVTSTVRKRSKSKTPPVRRRKSHSTERKYYTVGYKHNSMPDRPPRKKSSTSLGTLNDASKRSLSCDITQYVEIDDPQLLDINKDLKAGEIVSKMKDRPLPPPPRPPRYPKRKKNAAESFEAEIVTGAGFDNAQNALKSQTDDVIEIEVSTQTDPLPDDVDYELGMDDNFDISMSSSLRDIIDEEMLMKSANKLTESPRVSRPTSRSEKSLKLSDPKLQELARSSIGRTSPTVILVERRVSSPTRINEREEIVTEASLTVQHIDIDESIISDVPPLPKAKGIIKLAQSPAPPTSLSDERALERVPDSAKEIQLDNLVTQKLQVRDLDVGRLNVSELQASKILVTEMEGMTLHVSELDSKSGNIAVSGIEFSQNIIDEIVKKFKELTPAASVIVSEPPKPPNREEETQTEQAEPGIEPRSTETPITPRAPTPPPPPRPAPATSIPTEERMPPQRPPPPDLTPILYSYLQDLSMPSTSLFHHRTPRDRPFTEFHESQRQPSPLHSRRAKRKPPPCNESSSEDEAPAQPPRRPPHPTHSPEPTLTEAGAQFLRVFHSSVTRTVRNIFRAFMSYVSGAEDKKDVQMALVILLVLIAGLIMFGLSDSRTVHHHHWEFFNPPDSKQL